MCGIAGHIHLGGTADSVAVRRQLRLLERRGPDSSGVFAAGAGAIGQTRLAVIDLERGDPPICDESGDIGAVLNGEIYNFRDLRRALEAEGHSFRTDGDTEVIAHLAEDHDAAALARSLQGMFALAVWDAGRNRLMLARDRLGKKPLHYWWDGRQLVFGSEIKAVIAHPAVSVELDDEVIPAYLRFGYVPSPRTFFKAVRSLGPGEVLVIDDERQATRLSYWQPPVAPRRTARRHRPGLAAAAGEVRTGLEHAVRRRLVSDVPLGAFLSGGIDSSAVVAMMAQASDRPVRTFTIGFEDTEGFDERPHARLVADRYGTEHTEFVVRPQAVDLVEALVEAHDQPFGDSSAIPTYLLSQLTRQHVTVALSGDGGDELFAGYERFAAGMLVAELDRLPRPLRRALIALLSATPGNGAAAKVRRFAGNAGQGLPEAFRRWIAYIAEDEAESLIPDGGATWALDDYQRIWDSSAGAATLDRLLLLNLKTYLLDDLLPKVDRTSMAHGLEVRSPFLDHELVELAFSLPPRVKLRGMSLKRVLKEAVADLLPKEILDRPKHGFGVPLRRWFRDDLRAYLESMLGNDNARVRRYVEAESLDRLLGDHFGGRTDHGHAIWTLLTLEIFLRRYGW